MSEKYLNKEVTSASICPNESGAGNQRVLLKARCHETKTASDPLIYVTDPTPTRPSSPSKVHCTMSR